MAIKRLSYKPVLNKNQYEQEAWGENGVICGVDEVGRGCLAGPVVVAAAILHQGALSDQVRDSKLLSKQELLTAYDWIMNHAWYGIGILSHAHIDGLNIYQATLTAMKRAVMQVLTQSPYRPKAVVIDAMPLQLRFSGYEDIAVHHFPKGETLSVSIAAASIIAKVKRDTIMSRLEPLFPGFALQQHKGYATDVHCCAIRTHGRTIIHRLSFLNNITNNNYPDTIQQMTIEKASYEST